MYAALVAACAAALAAARPASAQDRATDEVRVIVNPATPVTSLPREQVSRLFLRKVARWDGGAPVLPVDLAESAAVRDAFSRAVHRRTVAMITGYWQRQIFSGRQLPPPDRASEADVVAYVRSTPGAIGYVSAAADLRGVRVLTVTSN
jgi:ABC-type phosphate transport system substrate-binding protein